VRFFPAFCAHICRRSLFNPQEPFQSSCRFSPENLLFLEVRTRLFPQVGAPEAPGEFPFSFLLVHHFPQFFFFSTPPLRQPGAVPAHDPSRIHPPANFSGFSSFPSSLVESVPPPVSSRYVGLFFPSNSYPELSFVLSPPRLGGGRLRDTEPPSPWGRSVFQVGLKIYFPFFSVSSISPPILDVPPPTFLLLPPDYLALFGIFPCPIRAKPSNHPQLADFSPFFGHLICEKHPPSWSGNPLAVVLGFSSPRLKTSYSSA